MTSAARWLFGSDMKRADSSGQLMWLRVWTLMSRLPCKETLLGCYHCIAGTAAAAAAQKTMWDNFCSLKSEISGTEQRRDFLLLSALTHKDLLQHPPSLLVSPFSDSGQQRATFDQLDCSLRSDFHFRVNWIPPHSIWLWSHSFCQLPTIGYLRYISWIGDIKSNQIKLMNECVTVKIS